MSADASNLLTGAGARVVVERMGEAASRFLASLTAEQRRVAVFAVDDNDERTRWHYTPIARNGLPLSQMERRQQRLAHQLVATGLSRAGYTAASTIMGLESTLDAIEYWRRADPGRDPQLYYLSLFGTPDARRLWGWRFEGHHLSLHYTILNGRIMAPTPTFFGANPAETQLSGVGVLRPLAGVEDLARELVHALDDEQRPRAILAPVAPPDIVLANRLKVIYDVLPERPEERSSTFTAEHAEALRFTEAPKGLPATAMTDPQREILLALVQEYTTRLPDEIAAIELEKLRRVGLANMHFAWAGGLARREGHYYRLQSSQVLVEYDNTQNDANHIHAVWRDFSNDWGEDLLAAHYAGAHQHGDHHHTHAHSHPADNEWSDE